MVIKSLWKLFISLSNADCKKAVASESAKCYGLDLSKAVSNKKGCITFFETKKNNILILLDYQLAVNEMNLSEFPLVEFRIRS